jgi:hypothetical protein
VCDRCDGVFEGEDCGFAEEVFGEGEDLKEGGGGIFVDDMCCQV